MGKFDGLLLCSDIDDTLLNSDRKVTGAVREAVRYFQKEGGIFTLTTGRGIRGVEICLNDVTPDVPVICYNGAALYDVKKKKYIKTCRLNPKVVQIVEAVMRRFPSTCVEIYTCEDTVFHNINELALKHIQNEQMPDIRKDFHEVTVPWLKIVFVQKPDETDALRHFLENGEFGDDYHFVQSTSFYYEILPAGTSKGAMLRSLTELIGIPIQKAIAVGDNENDMEMIEVSGVGVAMGNAIDSLKQKAQAVTSDHNHDGVSQLIRMLDEGKIRL